MDAMPWEDLCRIPLKKSIIASSTWLVHRFTHTHNDITTGKKLDGEAKPPNPRYFFINSSPPKLEFSSKSAFTMVHPMYFIGPVFRENEKNGKLIIFLFKI